MTWLHQGVLSKHREASNFSQKGYEYQINTHYDATFRVTFAERNVNLLNAVPNANIILSSWN